MNNNIAWWQWCGKLTHAQAGFKSKMKLRKIIEYRVFTTQRT